jgi:hypothetical protein
MKRVSRLLRVGLLLWLGPALGCYAKGLDEGAGAQTVFSQVNVCPLDQVRVTPRPDIAPHTLLGTTATPPAEIASDPARLQMWRGMMAQQSATIDLSGQTYQITGCGKQAYYVCGHPTVADYRGPGGLTAGNGSLTTNGNGTPTGMTVESAVTCLPSPAASGPTSGASTVSPAAAATAPRSL